MSKLEELIKKLCPDGVEYKSLSEVSTMQRGTAVTKNSITKGDVPVVAGGKTPAYYCADFNRDGETITVSGSGAYAGYVAYWNIPIFVSDAFSVKGQENSLTKYLYYFLQSKQDEIYSKKKGGGIPHVHISDIASIKIPVPPLPVQQEIVHILDNFTELTAELTAELTLRKKQYEYYRDRLLSFEDIRSADQMNNGRGYNYTVTYRKLGELCEYGKERISAETLSVENYISVENLLPNKQGKTAASKVPTGYVCIAYKRGDILIGNIRPYLKKIWLADCDGGTNGDVLVVQIKDRQAVQERFLYHCLSSERFFNYDDSNAKGAKMPRGDKTAVMDFEIPVPPLETQKHIVGILDKFEMLANSISDGLPAEIEARKKQYEYYRDKLLDFKDVGGGYHLLEKLVQWLPLGEIATITRGGNFQKKDFTSDGIPCIHYGQIYTKYGLYANETFTFISEEVAKKSKKATTNDIIMAVTSENIEDVCKCVAWLGKEDVAVSGHTAIIHHNQNAKYLAYYFHTQMFFAQKEKYAHGTKVIEVTPSKLSDIVIPLPPLEIQGWIAEILDKFHSLVTDISEGLPAEIEMRKKQYEYYRDKLLAFG